MPEAKSCNGFVPFESWLNGDVTELAINRMTWFLLVALLAARCYATNQSLVRLMPGKVKVVKVWGPLTDCSKRTIPHWEGCDSSLSYQYAREPCRRLRRYWRTGTELMKVFQLFGVPDWKVTTPLLLSFLCLQYSQIDRSRSSNNKGPCVARAKVMMVLASICF